MHTEFEVHMLNDAGKEKAGALAAIFDEALTKIEGIVGMQGREVAIVRTKLEEACFFAKKAMASSLDNQ